MTESASSCTRATAHSKRKTIFRGALAGVIVVILVSVAFYFFVGVRTAPQPVKSDHPTKLQSDKPAKATVKNTGLPETVTTARERLPMPKLSGERIEKREEIVAPQPLEEMVDAATNKVAKKRKVAFRNGMEQLIALATPSAPGASVPPLPAITEESVGAEVEKGLDHVITAEEDDTPELLEKKLTVAEIKEEFRELRETEGWGFAEYVNALRDKANADSDFMCEAHKICDELYHDKSVSDADYIKYRDQVNEKLRERGLPEIEKEESETIQENQPSQETQPTQEGNK